VLDGARLAVGEFDLDLLAARTGFGVRPRRRRLSGRRGLGPWLFRLAKSGRIGTDRLADTTVVRVVKASARRVGLDPKLFAGHSLRSGFLTSAAGRGASIFKMMDVSRHKSMDTLRGYVRDAELFRDHAGAGLL
jgi:hypothetical protein